MKLIIYNYSQPRTYKEKVQPLGSSEKLEAEVVSINAWLRTDGSVDLIDLGRNWVYGYICTEPDSGIAQWKVIFTRNENDVQLHSYHLTRKLVYGDIGTDVFQQEISFKDNKPIFIRTVRDFPKSEDRVSLDEVSDYDFRNNQWYRAMLKILPDSEPIKSVLENLVR